MGTLRFVAGAASWVIAPNLAHRMPFGDDLKTSIDGEPSKPALIPANPPLCPHLGTARYRARQTVLSHPGSCIDNNLHLPCNGRPAALFYAAVWKKTGRKRLNDGVRRLEITDAACRTSGRWEHRDHATGGPVRWPIRHGHKGSGEALQDSAATCGEFIGGDIRRCGGRASVVVVSANWRGVYCRELLPPRRLRTPVSAD